MCIGKQISSPLGPIAEGARWKSLGRDHFVKMLRNDECASPPGNERLDGDPLGLEAVCPILEAREELELLRELKGISVA